VEIYSGSFLGLKAENMILGYLSQTGILFRYGGEKGFSQMSDLWIIIQ
jgi:hypothetical protein